LPGSQTLYRKEVYKESVSGATQELPTRCSGQVDSIMYLRNF
jgi:hypothetical protein